MIQALFYKEFLKTRGFLLLAVLVLAGITGYVLLRIDRAIALQGIEHLWVVMVLKDALFVDLLQYVPLLIGLLLAVVQCAPEMQRKCLKLTLHLPCSPHCIIGGFLAYGFLALFLCFAVSYLLMLLYLPRHFSPELVARILLSATPWYLAGLAAYFFTVWICLEPTWKRRIGNLLVAALVLRVYFLAPGAEAYNRFLPVLTLYTLLTASLTWISVQRFKQGKQD